MRVATGETKKTLPKKNNDIVHKLPMRLTLFYVWWTTFFLLNQCKVFHSLRG